MKKNSELKNLIEETKKNEKIKKEKADKAWILAIIVLSFIISIIMTCISQSIIPNLPLVIGIIITFVFILLGILFDIIGVSVTTADEAVFHSMSARKVKGAATAVKFKKNAPKVSNFCCDVIGDVCGIVSGASGTAITAILVSNFGFNLFITGLIVSGLIASLTIGGKALGKSFAINKSQIILYEFAKFVSHFYH